MALRITIDELVLVGFDRRDGDAIGRAIEQAIAGQIDLASLRARARTGTHIPRVVTADVTVRSGSSAPHIGAGIGSVVAGSLTAGIERASRPGRREARATHAPAGTETRSKR